MSLLPASPTVTSSRSTPVTAGIASASGAEFGFRDRASVYPVARCRGNRGQRRHHRDGDLGQLDREKLTAMPPAVELFIPLAAYGLSRKGHHIPLATTGMSPKLRRQAPSTRHM